MSTQERDGADVFVDAFHQHIQQWRTRHSTLGRTTTPERPVPNSGASYVNGTQVRGEVQGACARSGTGGFGVYWVTWYIYMYVKMNNPHLSSYISTLATLTVLGLGYSYYAHRKCNIGISAGCTGLSLWFSNPKPEVPHPCNASLLCAVASAAGASAT